MGYRHFNGVNFFSESRIEPEEFEEVPVEVSPVLSPVSEDPKVRDDPQPLIEDEPPLIHSEEDERPLSEPLSEPILDEHEEEETTSEPSEPLISSNPGEVLHSYLWIQLTMKKQNNELHIQSYGRS